MALHSIRQATRADADEIGQVHYESWLGAHGNIAPQAALDQLTLERRKQEWRETLLKDNPEWVTLVACNGQLISGFVRFGPVTGAAIGQISYLYLANNSQGIGIGSRLLENALATLFAAGQSNVELSVVDGNEKALAFYKKLGGIERAAMITEGHLWRSQNRVIYWEKP